MHPDKQFFKCFSTGTGGDVFRFLMMTEGLDFPAAVRRLAERAGVHLEEEAGGGGGGDGGAVRSGAAATNSCGVGSSLARFVGKRFVCGECAGLFKRERYLGVDREVWAGVCTCGMDCDLGLGKENGFTEEEMIASGVALRAQSGRVYDRFRNRLMFPIVDEGACHCIQREGFSRRSARGAQICKFA